jgi:hypothetical protein
MRIALLLALVACTLDPSTLKELSRQALPEAFEQFVD